VTISLCDSYDKLDLDTGTLKFFFLFKENLNEPSNDVTCIQSRVMASVKMSKKFSC
jgi:hypothetical protein